MPTGTDMPWLDTFHPRFSSLFLYRVSEREVKEDGDAYEDLVASMAALHLRRRSTMARTVPTRSAVVC